MTLSYWDKTINHDLKNLSNWLNGNKIPVNVSKTELAVLTLLKKKLHHELKIKPNGNKLHYTDSVKDLGIH